VVRLLVTNKPPARADKAIRGQEVTALMLAVSQVHRHFISNTI
jgi:hypothetical protein